LEWPQSFAVNETVLIVHGLGGSGPGHWQSWLWQRLLERGVEVSYPDLPDPDDPKLEAWLSVLEEELTRLGPDGLVVACHSLGAVSWLHLAARTDRRLAERVVLVAPPSAGAGVTEIAGFVPAPLEAGAVARAAISTRLVCSDSGDPYRPEGPELFEPLGVPIDVIPGSGHLNTDAGYGEWPAVERWCLDPDAAPILGVS
jgi:predicted alpha/beta hydrolase family esterase